MIHGGVGAINESDVTLASASNAIIIGFNVRPDATAKSIADREKVDMRLYRVIYQAIEDVEAAMKGMLDPVYEEQVTGHAVVRQTFKASGVGTIAGSYVLDGKITRGCKARITREGEQIFEGPLSFLKAFQGRCEGGQRRLRVRPCIRGLQRPAGRRYDRNLYHGRGSEIVKKEYHEKEQH